MIQSGTCTWSFIHCEMKFAYFQCLLLPYYWFGEPTSCTFLFKRTKLTLFSIYTGSYDHLSVWDTLHSASQVSAVEESMLEKSWQYYKNTLCLKRVKLIGMEWNYLQLWKGFALSTKLNQFIFMTILHPSDILLAHKVTIICIFLVWSFHFNVALRNTIHRYNQGCLLKSMLHHVPLVSACFSILSLFTSI